MEVSCKRRRAARFKEKCFVGSRFWDSAELSICGSKFHLDLESPESSPCYVSIRRACKDLSMHLLRYAGATSL